MRGSLKMTAKKLKDEHILYAKLYNKIKFLILLN